MCNVAPCRTEVDASVVRSSMVSPKPSSRSSCQCFDDVCRRLQQRSFPQDPLRGDDSWILCIKGRVAARPRKIAYVPSLSIFSNSFY